MNDLTLDEAIAEIVKFEAAHPGELINVKAKTFMMKPCDADAFRELLKEIEK